MVKFAKFTKQEQQLVNKIVTRGTLAVGRERQALEMDISATHVNCPLDLDKLANAPVFDFTHDIVGIINNLNRDTGELENCFVPRCAKPEKETVTGREAGSHG